MKLGGKTIQLVKLFFSLIVLVFANIASPLTSLRLYPIMHSLLQTVWAFSAQVAGPGP
jgi:hypothetical protein